MRRGMLAVLLGALVVVVVSGAPSRSASAAGREDGPAAEAVVALTRADDAATDVLPGDFASVMGYQPVLVPDSGRRVLVRANGGCSSPFGGTAYGFTTACRQHDLGYDLLRYAADKGRPLGSWARHAVDQAFDRHLHQRCSDDRCRAVADVYAKAVGFNSIRQSYRVPVTETPWDWTLAAVAGLVVAVVIAVRRRSARSAR